MKNLTILMFSLRNATLISIFLSVKSYFSNICEIFCYPLVIITFNTCSFSEYLPIIGKPLLNPKIANRPSLNRAQSMKSAPRTPSPQSPVEATNTAVKFGTVRHMSSIIGQSLAANSGSQPLANSAQHSRSRPALNGRPSAPPPSVSSLKIIFF